MKKEICILGFNGYIGSALCKFLKKKKNKILKILIPRPKKCYDLKNFYEKFILSFLENNKKVRIIINCAGSISCKTREDYFFNSRFDLIFQNIILKKKLNIKYISLNSTKVFSSGVDNYALSKKYLHKKFMTNKNFLSLYIDLVFDKNSKHFQLIEKVLNITKVLPLPIFLPGKVFYPLNRSKLVKFIYKVIIKKNNFYKFVILGKQKFFFYQLIFLVMKYKKIRRNIFLIKSEFIKKFPTFFLKFFYRSKFFQQFDSKNFISNINKQKFKIENLDYRF